jgi:hypothetical protein
MTLAIKKVIIEKQPYIPILQEVGRKYIWCGYGKMFFYWIH